MMIFNKKDVFTSVTYEEAKRYIGEEGYFTNNFCTDLSKWDRKVLKDVYALIMVFFYQQAMLLR